jgi:hypothetical protein
VGEPEEAFQNRLPAASLPNLAEPDLLILKMSEPWRFGAPL